MIVLVGILFFYEGTFTGRVVDENCTEVEVCENVTIQVCDELCEEVCEDEVSLNCSIQIIEECEEVCTEEGNETICVEECFPVETEICENVTTQVCGEVCSQVNCTEEIVENCSIEEVCIPIELEEEVVDETEDEPQEEVIDETIDETGEEIVVEEVTSIERFNFVANTGVSDVVVFDEGIRNGRLVIRFVAGSFWVEKTYDESLSGDLLENEILNDKNLFIKKIGGYIR